MGRGFKGTAERVGGGRVSISALRHYWCEILARPIILRTLHGFDRRGVVCEHGLPRHWHCSSGQFQDGNMGSSSTAFTSLIRGI